MKKNAGEKKCSTPFCRNKAYGNGKVCCKCTQRRYKAKNPLNYAFYKLKGNAKRRGKDFNLSLEEFKIFCESTGYLEKKGRFATSLTIDRIDANKGYQIDNIQILTNTLNIRKRYVDLKKRLGYYPTEKELQEWEAQAPIIEIEAREISAFCQELLKNQDEAAPF